MIVTDHAAMRLKERYGPWGLDVKAATRFLMDLVIIDPPEYQIVEIDGILVVLVCKGDVICTVYPHPLDMAEQTREYKQQIVELLRSNSDLYKKMDRMRKKKDSAEKKVVKYKNKLRGMYR